MTSISHLMKLERLFIESTRILTYYRDNYGYTSDLYCTIVHILIPDPHFRPQQKLFRGTVV